MSFIQNNIKIIAVIGIFAVAAGGVIAVVVLNSENNSTNGIKVTLLNNAGIMIEKENTRIYIDPFDLPSDYSDYPANIILITHDHGDHYDPSSIDLIATENTNLYFPAIMDSEVLQYEAIPVQPGDTFELNDFNLSCFYMYTPDSHPKSSNYTSYIIEFDSFTIFHAGDSWNIEEYEQLTDRIDLVLLPLGPGCQTMTDADVVTVIETIRPSYFIPIHYAEETKDLFISTYSDSIEDCDCEFIDLDYFDSYSF